MDSRVQSPGMADHLLSSTWNPYNPRFMNQPLATSMHAMVPHNYMPHNPQLAHADTAMIRRVEDRIGVLKQQQFQDGLNAHFRAVQTSQSLQHLQNQVQQMQHVQRSLSYDNSSLRLQLLDFQARQDIRDNEDCTRRIQLEPRTQEQKLESAMKNVNLMRIYAGVSLSGNATFEEVSLKGAEQMEALAKTLRSRVNRGGAAYLLEAEDAEAWAKKLREHAQPTHAQPTQSSEVENKLSETPEVPVEDESKAINQSDDDVFKADWDAYVAQLPDEPLEWNAPPHSKVATPSRRSKTPDATIDPFVTQNPDIVKNTTWTFDNTAPLWSPKIHASPSPEPLKTASSVISIKIEEPSESNFSPVKIEAIPELQVRKLAPHQKYAAQHQQTKASEDLVPAKDATVSEEPKCAVAREELKDASVKEEPAPSISAKDSKIEKAVQEAQVSPEKPTSSTPPDGLEIENTVQEAQVPSKKLPPHRRYVSAKAEAPILPEVELGNTTKEEPPQTSMKTNKSKKSKSRRKARKTESPKATSAALTPWDHDKPKEEVMSDKQDEPKKDLLSENQDELKEDMPPTKQNENNSLPDTNTQIWQPSYLRDLPPLPEDELQTIPSAQEMHQFERKFILTHLGGTRWLTSFYSIPSSELSLLPGRGFYLLEDSTEPLAPLTPGSHGSLLTPILRLPEENNPETPKPESMQNAPLFLKKGEKYIYCGMYSYLRSDRLDIERCSSLITPILKTHWANQLTSSARPKWVTEILQTHLCPPPTYSGPLPSHMSCDAASSALTSHMQDHETWFRDTHLKTSFLRPQNIVDAFEAPDTGAEMPGIRFWCLGLKCESWDKGFYDMMVREEKIWERQGRKDGEKEREQQKEMLRVLSRKSRPVKW